MDGGKATGSLKNRKIYMQNKLRKFLIEIKHVSSTDTFDISQFRKSRTVKLSINHEKSQVYCLR